MVIRFRFKQTILLLTLLSTLLLCGCVSGGLEEKSPTDATLPPVRPVPDAPIGDSQDEREYAAVLYLPNADGSSLEAVSSQLIIRSGQTRQEAVVLSLLEHINASPFWTSAQRLSLANVPYPVEVMQNFTCVNLNTAARTLSPDALFALRMSITNTLTELSDTEYVSVLINGRDPGLDVAMTLPTGALARYPNGEIAVFRGQIAAQQEIGDAPLQKIAALYFPSDSGNVLVGEVRNLTLSNRTAAGFAKALLEELFKGPAQLTCARGVMPPDDYLSSDPLLLVPAGSSAKYIELYFRPELDDYLALIGSTRGELLSSVCYTLTGFIPGLDGIVCYVNGELITEATLPGGGIWSTQNGQLLREDLATSLGAVCTAYYPLSDSSGLRGVTRPIPQRFLTQPRALFRELMNTPTSASLHRALPEPVTDADLLGLQIRNNAALLNLSESFALSCLDMSADEERNMIYSIVNTLTELDGVTTVRFYVAGQQQQLASHLYMGGEFLRHPGIIVE